MAPVRLVGGVLSLRALWNVGGFPEAAGGEEVVARVDEWVVKER